LVDARERRHATVDALTVEHESKRPDPWAVSDPPHAYVQRMLRGIASLEIRVDRIEGKFKASRNRPAADRQRIGAALAATLAAALEAALAAAGVRDAALAELVRAPRMPADGA
jgi:transcriptional regulator